jgi:enoyl-CoA hydratase
MSVVELEINDGIAVVTLNRPEVMNAMNPELIVKLERAWLTVRDNPAVRVAILTGAGTKSFSSGADLGRLIPLLSGARPPEDEYDRAIMTDKDLMARASLQTLDVSKPVIAAVNGYAMAGGMEMLQGTDLRVASTTATFGLREVQRGLVAHGGSCVRLARQVPYVQAMEILLLGDAFDAAKALEIGLVNYVVEPDQVMDKAMDMARRIAANGPLAVQLTRRAVRECLGRPERDALALEDEIGMTVYATEDAKEGPRAFMEKREPVFVGR